MVLNTFTLFCNPHYQIFFTLNSTPIKKQSSLPRPQHPVTPTLLPGGMSDVLSVSCKFNHKYLSVSCFLAHEASCCSTCQESHSPWRSVTAHPQVQAIGGQSIYPLVAMWMVCPFRCCEYRGEHVVQRSVHIPTFNSCGYISGIAGVDGDSVFGFLRNYHTFSPAVATPLNTPTSNVEGLQILQIWPNAPYSTICLSMFTAKLVDMVGILPPGYLHFPKGQWCWASFLCLRRDLASSAEFPSWSPSWIPFELLLAQLPCVSYHQAPLTMNVIRLYTVCCSDKFECHDNIQTRENGRVAPCLGKQICWRVDVFKEDSFTLLNHQINFYCMFACDRQLSANGS